MSTKRFTVEVNHRVVKECDDPKEADHFFRIEMRSRRGSGEKVGIFDNRENKWERVPVWVTEI